MDGDAGKEFTPSPLNYTCPKCRSYYAGKIPVLNYTDERFLEGLLPEPPIIMTRCHGVHPTDPWEGKD